MPATTEFYTYLHFLSLHDALPFSGYEWRDLDQFHAAARRLWLGNTGAADSVHGVYGHGDHRCATEPVMNVSPVELIEVGPRDGLQNESVPVDTATKLELIQRLLDAGQRRIEVTSFVNPKKVPQMADADALCEPLPQHPHARYAGLVLNERGYARAGATGRLTAVCYVVCASDSFGQRNQGQSIEQGLQVTGAITRADQRDGLTTSATITADGNAACREHRGRDG